MTSSDFKDVLRERIEGLVRSRLGAVEAAVETARREVDDALGRLRDAAVASPSATTDKATLDQLSAEINARVGQAAAESSRLSGDLALLRDSVVDIDGQTTQADVLNALVERAYSFAPRVVLFVVKGEDAIAWAARGFEDEVGDDAVRGLSVSTRSDTLIGSVLHAQKTFLGESIDQKDNAVLLDRLGSTNPERIAGIPLRVRGKTVGILYADSYDTSVGSIGIEALELLVHSAGIIVELASLRQRLAEPPRAAGTGTLMSPPPAAVAAEPAPAPAPAEPVAAVEVEPEPVPVAAAEPDAEPVAVEPEPFAVEAEPEPEPFAVEVELEPEPFAVEVEPEPAPFAVAPEPAAPEPEPVEAEPEPFVTAEPEPAAPESEPVSAFVVDTVAVAEPEPKYEVTTPYPSFAEPEVEPVATQAEPEPSPFALAPEAYETDEAEPITVEAEPAAPDAWAEPEVEDVSDSAEITISPENDAEPVVPDANPFALAGEPEPASIFEISAPTDLPPPAGASPFELPDDQQPTVQWTPEPPTPAEPAAPARAAAPPAAGEMTPEEEKLHNDARRFARLLVSEIKLYNEQAVSEGRQNFDLYERLKDDIDRSRQMYDKRVAAAVAERFDYFYDELVSTLAEGEANKLGSGCPGPTV